MERHDELLDVARGETGLDDFGDDSFREGLEVLVRSLDTEANLNDVGEMVTRGQIVRYLGQRLQIEDWYRRHPEIADTVIESPLIGLGLPRTGSTALSCLLGEDPNARSLRRWESSEPCPPPSTVEPPDPRLVRALEQEEEQRQSGSAGLVPGGPTSPAECQDMMALTFASQLFLAFARIPSYADWLFDADLTPTYLYERRTLQLLQWGMPSRPWRLKCPNHLLFLEHLDNAFPHARYVMTNRDPTEVLLSVAELYTQVGKNLSDDYDLGYAGAVNVQQWSLGMDRALAFRDAGNDDRFYDIDFRAMQREPIEEVRGLYAWLGEPVTDEFEAGMRQWWKDNAENREPRVRSDPALYGLDLDVVRELFTEYRTRLLPE
ncbi:MAG: sulfotransferase family protein [Acidimicrobiia bacterium]